MSLGRNRGDQGWNLPSVLQQAKWYLRERVTAGGVAVDATVGNGHDTLFLAELVGETGRVYGFDIQQSALDAADRRLTDAGLHSRVTLLYAGHERMAELLPVEAKGKIQAATFNLGYLPGGDKTVVTRPDMTIAALYAAWEWLAPGGIITVVLYNGHPGGQEEQDEVLTWAKMLEQRAAQVLWYQFLNQSNHPPTLLVISKNG
jgi:predicted methyltransferase